MITRILRQVQRLLILMIAIGIVERLTRRRVRSRFVSISRRSRL